MKKRTWAIVGFAAVAAIGGYLLLDDRAPVDTDPWYRLPPGEFFQSGEAKERDPTTFAVVAPESEAISRLEQSPWVEVSEREAAALVGRSLGGSGGRLVLLRALAWDTPHGMFTVRWRSGEVDVQHNCLGSRPLPLVRRAVVARLPDVPSEVYVGVSMAK